MIFLTSCIQNQQKHGYAFDLSDYQMLQEGVTTRENVLRFMGSPTIISNLTDESWIYYSENVENLLFFIPDTKERMILSLKFDGRGILSSLEKFDLSDEKKELSFTSKYTEVESNKIGFFKSIFSNVGQVRAGQ